MEEENDRRYGTAALAAMRVTLGFMMVWAFFDKLFGLGRLTAKEAAMVNGGSPTEYYLSELVKGPFEGLWDALAGNAFVDWLLMFGLIALGTSLMLGIAKRLSTVGTAVMLVLMYTLCVPPQDNILVDYHMFYILGILAVYWLGGFERFSLIDRWKGLPVVRDHAILR